MARRDLGMATRRKADAKKGTEMPPPPPRNSAGSGGRAIKTSSDKKSSNQRFNDAPPKQRRLGGGSEIFRSTRPIIDLDVCTSLRAQLPCAARCPLLAIEAKKLTIVLHISEPGLSEPAIFHGKWQKWVANALETWAPCNFKNGLPEQPPKSTHRPPKFDERLKKSIPQMFSQLSFLIHRLIAFLANPHFGLANQEKNRRMKGTEMHPLNIAGSWGERHKPIQKPSKL